MERIFLLDSLSLSTRAPFRDASDHLTYRARARLGKTLMNQSNDNDKDTLSSFGVGIKSLLTEKRVLTVAPQLKFPAPLYPISEIEAGLCETADLEPLQKTVAWMRAFLAKPHPNLGRTGPVCPFVPISISLDTIHLACLHTPADAEPEVIEDVVNRFRDIFLELEPKEGEDTINKSLLMVFPRIPLDHAGRLIDAVQQRLKPRFTRYGLMLGEFHELNETPGLRNPDFRPLRSPLCMLVIRYMVESDLPFLERPNDPAGTRVGFLRSYLRRLGGKVSERKLDLAIDALIDAEIELRNVRAHLAAETPAAAETAAEATETAETSVGGVQGQAGKCPFHH